MSLLTLAVGSILCGIFLILSIVATLILTFKCRGDLGMGAAAMVVYNGVPGILQIATGSIVALLEVYGCGLSDCGPVFWILAGFNAVILIPAVLWSALMVCAIVAGPQK